MVRKRLESFGHAFRGLGTVIRNEPNARIHLAASVFVAALGTLFRVTALEWAILAIAAGIVWSAEALNSGLEFLADHVAPEKHELVKKAKDAAAGGVLAAAIAAAAAGLMIFLPYLLQP